MSPRLLVITNSDAGSADAETRDAAVALLRGQADVVVQPTSDPEELREVLAHADADRTVVVAGGDGSIHAVLQALHDLDDLAGRTVGLIPLGTGNDFARTLGIPLDAVEAARVLLTGVPRPTDLVVDDAGQVTVNHVHVGAGAEAGKEGARWKERLGRIGYAVGALRVALDPPMLRIRVEVDGEVVADERHRVLMVAVGNGASVGGGTELTPDADPHDGLLDVLVATPERRPAQLGYLLRLPLARHQQHDQVRIVRGRRVTVSGSAFDCNSDGEIDGPVTARTWQVAPAAYSMVVPAE